MRYIVKARLKAGKATALLEAIDLGTLGAGSVAGTEYLRDMADARQLSSGEACWVEVCYCNIPLDEERPYWEEYFDLTVVKNAHARSKCQDLNGEKQWACSECDCTKKLEAHIAKLGGLFVNTLRGKG